MKVFGQKKYKNRICEYIVVGILVIVMFFCFYYSDLSCIMDNSILMIKAIGTGHIRDMYEFSIQNSHSIWAMNYDMLPCLLMAAWNIPILIAEQCFGLDYMNSIWAHLWCKGFLIVVLGLILWMMIQILKTYGYSQRNRTWMILLFMSSLYILFPTMYAVQIDVLSVLFMLIGIWRYLKQDTRGFLIAFALAIPMKLFAIFLFIPLLLLHEKRIPHLVGKFLAGCSLTILMKLLYKSSVAYTFMSKSLSWYTIRDLIQNNIQLCFGVSLFLVLYVAINVYCYITPSGVEIKDQYRVLYLPVLIYGMFVTLIPIRVYWVALMAPFLILLIVINTRYYKVNVLIESITGVAFVLTVMLRGDIFGESNFWVSKMLFGKLFSSDLLNCMYLSPGDWLQSMGIDVYLPFLTSVYVGGILALLVLNRPGRYEPEEETEHNITSGYIWMRIVLMLLIIGIPLYTYGKKLDNCLTTNMSEIIDLSGNDKLTFHNYLTELCGMDDRELLVYHDGSQGVENMINQDLSEHVMEQPIEFDENARVTSIRFRMDVTGNMQQNTSSVQIQLIDSTTGDVLADKVLGASLIKENEIQEIRLKHVPVLADRKYIVRFTGIPGHEIARNQYPLYLRTYSDENNTLAPAVWNGTEQDYSILLEVRGR